MENTIENAEIFLDGCRHPARFNYKQKTLITMNLPEQEKALIESAGYEYLDERFCYAKPNGNISIQVSQHGTLYIHITRSRYNRGLSYDPSDGVFVGYFSCASEMFGLIEKLSPYTIK